MSSLNQAKQALKSFLQNINEDGLKNIVAYTVVPINENARENVIDIGDEMNYGINNSDISIFNKFANLNLQEDNSLRGTYNSSYVNNNY